HRLRPDGIDDGVVVRHPLPRVRADVVAPEADAGRAPAQGEEGGGAVLDPDIRVLEIVAHRRCVTIATVERPEALLRAQSQVHFRGRFRQHPEARTPDVYVRREFLEHRHFAAAVYVELDLRIRGLHLPPELGKRIDRVPAIAARLIEG